MRTSRIISLFTVLIIVMVSLSYNSCSKNDGTTAVVAVLYISPTSGTLTTVFTFDGSASHDGNNSTEGLMYRWDADSDGIWDIDWTLISIVDVTINTPGTFLVTMEVKTTADNTSTDSKPVTVAGGGGSTFTDPRDGKVYNIVTIGSQVWMAENMNYETGNSWCYDNDPANCATYGRLYDWETVLGACPSGWHLPNDNEWCTLTQFIDPTVNCNITEWSGTDVGLKMKSTSGWYDNGNGSNSSGFTALPGGYRHTNGSFSNLTYTTYFWSSTEYSSTLAWGRGLGYDYGDIYRNASNKTYGFSARCVKD